MFKSRLLFILALFGAHVLNQSFRTVETKTVFLSLIALPAISFLISYYISRKISITLKIHDSRIEKGSSTDIEITILNPTLFLCPYIKINLIDRNGFSLQNNRLFCSILPKRSRTFRIKLDGLYRGVFDAGIESCHIEDFLRLFSFKCDFASNHEISVVPKIRTINSKLFHYHNDGLAMNTIGANDDPSSFYDIIPYDPSNDIRRIHWKLTARLSELMVQKFDKENGAVAAVLADFSSIDGDEFERLIIEDRLSEAFVSICDHLIKNYNAIDFIFAGDKPEVINNCSRVKFDQLFQICSTHLFGSRLSAADLVNHYTELNACRNIIIITNNPDENLIKTIAKTSGKDIGFKVISTRQESINLLKSNATFEYYTHNDIYLD